MAAKRKTSNQTLEKCPTGIRGLDEITGGGLPRGRPSLVCGSAGCGKTLMAMEFIARGAMEHNEPGVVMTFEETGEELAQNVASLGFDLDALVRRRKIAVDYVRIERSEIEETGDYDLEGLFVRLGYAIDSVGAKRVVLDTIESLFAGLLNTGILRAELRRLFRWLKDRAVTTIITGERGEGTLTRHGLEEYVSDCVILLDHRVNEQISTRRLRVVKYRGSVHGTNEYPFIIDRKGISVLPITSLGLEHAISSERVSSGLARLDAMIGGKGFYRGSSILISGTAGTGKTTLASHFVDAACRRGEKCVYLAFEESPRQITRNMQSIGLDLEQWVKKKRLTFRATRPTLQGLEAHLLMMHELIDQVKPDAVVIDPVTNLMSAGTSGEAHLMLLRLIDYLKSEGITALMTTLTHASSPIETSQSDISSLIDTWILLRHIETGGERNRGLYVLKSRGMPHSNQIREYLITNQGIELLDIYLGPSGAVTGSARLAQEASDRAGELQHAQDFHRKRAHLESSQKALDARIAALRAQQLAQEQDIRAMSSDEIARGAGIADDRNDMVRNRMADGPNRRRNRGDRNGGKQ